MRVSGLPISQGLRQVSAPRRNCLGAGRRLTPSPVGSHAIRVSGSFPVGVFGSSSTDQTIRGYLKRPPALWTNAMSLFLASGCFWPPYDDGYYLFAIQLDPRYTDDGGLLYGRIVRTGPLRFHVGRCCNPLRTITSFFLSTMKKYPSSSRSARSPVWNQPPTMPWPPSLQAGSSSLFTDVVASDHNLADLAVDDFTIGCRPDDLHLTPGTGVPIDVRVYGRRGAD